MKKILPVIMGFLLSLVGCKSSDKSLIGKWETRGLNKDGIAQQIVYSYIEFEAKGPYLWVHGEPGVNTFSGPLKASDSKLAISDFPMTRMMGEPAVQEFEDMFMQVIMNADSYSIEGNILTVKASEKNMELIFKKIK